MTVRMKMNDGYINYSHNQVVTIRFSAKMRLLRILDEMNVDNKTLHYLDAELIDEETGYAILNTTSMILLNREDVFNWNIHEGSLEVCDDSYNEYFLKFDIIDFIADPEVDVYLTTLE